ncbi:MAG: response regulator [Deltaproteobacteria bacterium]|nr:response regulator [Deltaproteobacteria bacterium]
MKREIYTVGQAAEYCSLSRGTVWRYIKSGDLRASQTPGGHFRILRRDLDAFVAEKGETASSGFEAGAKVATFRPGLIILDLLMPEMSGFELCRLIKEDPKTSHIKVLAVVTGFDTKEHRERIMKAGADGYMAKPLSREGLLRHVKGLFNGDGSGVERPSHMPSGFSGEKMR